MKKKSVMAIVMSVVLVLCVSVGLVYFFHIRNKIDYTKNECLNTSVKDDMKMHEIAELYTKSCVTIYAQSKSPMGTIMTSMGSGVCIASNGFVTASGYEASAGSYFATNYHVISQMVDPLYKNYDVDLFIKVDQGKDYLDAQLLWESKDMDLAIVYCKENLEINWIEMKDRTVYYSEEDKFGFDEIFTLGTPLDDQYQNTYSEGRIKNLNFNLVEATGEMLYTFNRYGSGYDFSTDEQYVEDIDMFITDKQEYIVLSNIYENAVMMSCDIAPGNSGGGVFDERGYLVGLSTLGLSYTSAGTASINFFVPIYPIMQILDRIIENKETNAGHIIYEPENLGLKVIDANEATSYSQAIKLEDKTIRIVNLVKFDGQEYYYYDETLYNAKTYQNAFSFNQEGVYIMTNDGQLSSLPKDFVITGVDKNGENKVEIKTRNDLLYFLLSCNKGEQIHIYGHRLIIPVEVGYSITL